MAKAKSSFGWDSYLILLNRAGAAWVWRSAPDKALLAVAVVQLLGTWRLLCGSLECPVAWELLCGWLECPVAWFSGVTTGKSCADSQFVQLLEGACADSLCVQLLGPLSVLCGSVTIMQGAAGVGMPEACSAKSESTLV